MSEYIVKKGDTLSSIAARQQVGLQELQRTNKIKAANRIFPGQKLYIPNDVNAYARWKISERKEVNVKDKFIKIKVRYTGNELAIISAIKTLYRISYA